MYNKNWHGFIPNKYPLSVMYNNKNYKKSIVITERNNKKQFNPIIPIIIINYNPMIILTIYCHDFYFNIDISLHSLNSGAITYNTHQPSCLSYIKCCNIQ